MKVILLTCGESKKKKEVEANTIKELREELQLASAHLQVRRVSLNHDGTDGSDGTGIQSVAEQRDTVG